MRPLDDNISPCAGGYRLELGLLGLGHSELVKCLLEIVEKGVPLCRCNHEMLVRISAIPHFKGEYAG
jgi:hypothetical protein